MITANLQHPAIVPVYELGRWASGAPFYAMKLVAGRSFEEVVRHDTGPELRDRLARLPVIVSVAEALAYAHGRRVIHRDLKPANVLVGDFGETVVIDWGLAKVFDAAEPAPALAAVTLSGPPSAPPPGDALALVAVAGEHTVAGAIMGTPSYMPPEQAVGDAVDERADVYAIGAMLYFLISGMAPFADRKPRDVTAVLALAAASTPTPLAELQPTAPPDLIAIATKAMARDPAQRYPSARELADDLRRFTTGQLVSAHRYDLRALIVRWLRRHRAAVTVAAILLAVLIAGGVFSVRRIIASEREATAEAHAAQDSLAAALNQKGRVAESGQAWADAAMYYAASGVKHGSPEARWAAGFAEARAVTPQVHHAGHTAVVHALAVAPDGERVASVDEHGELRVWSRRDGALIAARRFGTRALFAVAFAPDGSELAVAGDDGIIWRLAPNLSPRGELRGHAGRIWCLAYSPRGGLLASSGGTRPRACGRSPTARAPCCARTAARVQRRVLARRQPARDRQRRSPRVAVGRRDRARAAGRRRLAGGIRAALYAAGEEPDRDDRLGQRGPRVASAAARAGREVVGVVDVRRGLARWRGAGGVLRRRGPTPGRSARTRRWT